MDPFGSMQGFLGQFNGFMRNPMQFMMQRKLGIPQQYMNNPQQALQYLMNTGRLTQQDYDNLHKTAEQIMQTPDFNTFISNMNKSQNPNN